jgi:hypothetical protein
MNRNYLSALAVLIFSAFAIASVTVKTAGTNNFLMTPQGEEEKDSSIYIVKNDGSRVYGKNIYIKDGSLLGKGILLDDVKYPISEIVSYWDGRFNAFCLKKWGFFIIRIVHGRINVYYKKKINNDPKYSWNEMIIFFAQKDNSDDMPVISDTKDVRKLVSDCPEALAMLDDKNFEPSNGGFTKVFMLYNSKCPK